MRYYSGIFLVVVIAAIATPSNGNLSVNVEGQVDSFSNFTTGTRTSSLFPDAVGFLQRATSATLGLKRDLRTVGSLVAQGLWEAATSKRLAITNSLRRLRNDISARKRGAFMSSRPRTAAETSGIFGPFVDFLNTILDTLGVTSANVTSGNLQLTGNDGEKEVTTIAATTDLPTINAATPNPKTIENHQRDNLFVLFPTPSSAKSPSTPVNILTYKSQRSASPSTAAIETSSSSTTPTTSWGVPAVQ